MAYQDSSNAATSPANIRRLRQRLELSEAAFGRWAGLTGAHAKDTVHKWETGKLAPKASIAARIEAALL